MSIPIADRLSNTDLEIIRTAIEEILSKAERTKASDVFEKVSSNINLPQTTFCQSLSANIKSKRLSGYYSIRGPYGGIFKGELKDKPIKAIVEKKVQKPVKTETISPATEIKPNELVVKKEVVEVSPIEKKKPEPKPYLSGKKPTKPEPLKNILYNPAETFFLFINDEKFSVPCHFLYIKTLLTNVFAATEDPNGSVKFQDRIYSVNDVEKLQSVLLWFLNTSIICSGEKSTKEPVLNIIDEPVVISPRLLENI